MLQSIRAGVRGRRSIHWRGEDESEPFRAGVDRLHLERHCSREVDAEQSTAIRLRHPSRFGDAADIERTARIERQAQRAEEPLPPEWKARPLVDAVYLLDVGTEDGPT